MSNDLLISHITIALYRILSYFCKNRCNTDQRRLGGLFYEPCNKVNELDWAVALQQLIDLHITTLKKSNNSIRKLNPKSTAAVD